MDNQKQPYAPKFRRSYLISEIGGVSFIRGSSGNNWIEDPDEIKSVISGLQNLIRLLNEKPATWEDGTLRSNYAVQLADAIARGESAKWTFRHTDDDIQLITRPCVYFLRGLSSGYENYIKIGCTKRLEKRVHEVRASHLNIEMEVVATVETDRYEDLEKLYHYQFELYRSFSEFFFKDQIEWYLAYMEQLQFGFVV